MLAKLKALDADIKRIAFVYAGLFAVAEVAGLVLGAMTGAWGLAAAAAGIAGIAAVLFAIIGGLWWAAVRLFPTTKED